MRLSIDCIAISMACRLLACVGLLSLLGVPVGCATRGGDPEVSSLLSVRLIGFNDFHGNLEPPNIAVQSRGETGAARPVPAGGAAYLASAIAALKAGHPNHAVIPAGEIGRAHV